MFSLGENNISLDERHRLSRWRMDVLSQEAEQAQESVVLSNKMDLIMILDESGSMDAENQEYIYGHARSFLERLTGSRLDEVDLQVKFLGAGEDGWQARLLFDGPQERSILDDLFETEDDGTGTLVYRYPLIRAYLMQTEGLADDPALDAWLQSYAGPADYLVPPVLGDEAFVTRFGDRSTLTEWFELYVRNTVDPTSPPQGGLLISLERFLASLEQGGTEGRPRADALLSIVLMTDDIEKNFADPIDPMGPITWGIDYMQDPCEDPEARQAAGYADEWECKTTFYAHQILDHIEAVCGTTDVRAFSLACIDTDRSTNSNCAREVDAPDPPYRPLTELTGGLHIELPETEEDFVAALDEFAARIHLAGSLRFRIALPAWPASVEMRHAGEVIPVYAQDGERGWVCLDEGPGCRTFQLVGYTPDDIPVGDTIELSFVSMRSADVRLLELPLSDRPDPDSLLVELDGRRLQAGVDYTYDDALRSVQLDSPSFGTLRARYRLHPDEPLESYWVGLRNLPDPLSLRVEVGGEALPVCVDEPDSACFRFREYRFVEVVAGKRDGQPWPAAGDWVRVVYRRIDHLPDWVKEPRPVLFLAEPVADPQAGLAVYRVLPEDQGYAPLVAGDYEYDPSRQALALLAQAEYGELFVVDYSPRRPGQSQQALDESWLELARGTSVYQQACLGPNAADPQQTVNEGLDAQVALRVGQTALSEPESDERGAFRRVAGLGSLAEFKLYDAMLGDCGDDDALAAILLNAEANRAMRMREPVWALCLTVAAEKRCSSPRWARQAGFLIGEIGRWAELLFDQPGRKAEEHLRAAREINSRIIADGAPTATLVNQAWVLADMADRGLDSPSALRAEAEGLLQRAAARSNLATAWDQLALFYELSSPEPGAAADAMTRAAGSAPYAASAHGGEQMRGPCSQDSMGQAFDALGAGGGCELTPCELQIKLILGIPPLVSLGVVLAGLFEYAICTLEALQCYQACGGGHQSSACLGQAGGMVGAMGDLLGALAGAWFGGPFAIGVTVGPDGDYNLSADLSASGIEGVSLSGSVSGNIDGQAGPDVGIALVFEASGDLPMDGFSADGQWEVGLNYNSDTGQITVDGSASADLGMPAGLGAFVDAMASANGPCR